MAVETALLLAGQLRTFDRCAALMKQNLVDCNRLVIFALVEGTSNQTDVKALLRRHFGDDVRIGAVLTNVTYRTDEYGFHTAFVLPRRPALTDEAFARCGGDRLRAYIFNGGTIIQYYQLRLLWNAVQEFETAHDMRFDAVIRGRWDGLLTIPLRITDWFANVDWAEDAHARWLGSPDLERVLLQLAPGKGLWWDDVPPAGARPTNTVWTFGSEQFWVAPRATFALLVRIYDEYGQFNRSEYSVPMDSESVFHLHCRHYGITHWNFQEVNNPRFNVAHAGTTGPILQDPFIFTLVR